MIEALRRLKRNVQQYMSSGPQMPIEEWSQDHCTKEYLNNLSRFPDLKAQFYQEVNDFKFFDMALAHLKFKEVLGQYQVKAIQKYCGGKKSLAIFCPTKAFRKHFGDVDQKLQERGFAVVHLYGTAVGDSFESKESSFYFGGDGFLSKDQLEIIDVFLTASIMDCLPDKSIKVLMDHLSFVEFSPHSIDQLIERNKDVASRAYTEELFNELVRQFAYKSAFIPLVDYYFIPTEGIMENMIEWLHFDGYFEDGVESKADYPLNSVSEIFMDRLRHRRMASRLQLVPTGYPKIEKRVKQMKGAVAEKIIVYAPTPNDTVNKIEWLPYMSINEHGSSIIEALCKNFPDYKVVFKPYDDEIAEVVDPICKTGEQFSNFERYKGKDYMELYSKAAIMVSDFSSTAYTFSFSTLRPSVFYSHNEKTLIQDKRDLEDQYCSYRDKVGQVAQNPEQLVQSVKNLLADPEGCRAKIEKLRGSAYYHLDNSEDVVVERLSEIVSGQQPKESRSFKASFL